MNISNFVTFSYYYIHTMQIWMCKMWNSHSGAEDGSDTVSLDEKFLTF